MRKIAENKSVQKGIRTKVYEVICQITNLDTVNDEDINAIVSTIVENGEYTLKGQFYYEGKKVRNFTKFLLDEFSEEIKSI